MTEPIPEPERERAIRHILSMVMDARGYDFTQYQPAFVLRRLRRITERRGMTGGVTELAARIDPSSDLLDEIIEGLGLPVTEAFRNPPFWRSLRELTAEHLAPQGFIRAWVAGCATGEEAYSLSILFQETPELGGALIYATDINQRALARARTGRISTDGAALAAKNYAESGGTRTFGDYLTETPDGLAFDPQLRSDIVFAKHSLVSDASFNSFHLILCRNVMIYFNADLHRHVHTTLLDSLNDGGILGLGARESIRSAAEPGAYMELDAQTRIYRRRPS